MHCANHPQIETELTCGRCEKPLCPRCLIQTPVGGRCRQCSGIRRLPVYHVSPLYLARGAGATLASGAVSGAVWWFVFPYSLNALLLILIALGIGYIVSEAILWATNRRSGPPLQALAIVGVATAYFMRNILFGEFLIPPHDTLGYITVALAALMAINRLR